jgi:hypothetical protein
MEKQADDELYERLDIEVDDDAVLQPQHVQVSGGVDVGGNHHDDNGDDVVAAADDDADDAAAADDDDNYAVAADDDDAAAVLMTMMELLTALAVILGLCHDTSATDLEWQQQRDT